MKVTRSIITGVALPLACELAGCGPSAAERAAQEEERLKLEMQDQREAQKANAAITTMNQKLGRKALEFDLGLATETKTEPAPSRTQQP